MTKEETTKINERHIPTIDKQYRMHGGLSSELMDYEEGCIMLRITISGRWTKSHQETALQIAKSWKDNNPELANATSYRAFISETKKGYVSSKEIQSNFEI